MPPGEGGGGVKFEKKIKLKKFDTFIRVMLWSEAKAAQHL